MMIPYIVSRTPMDCITSLFIFTCPAIRPLVGTTRSPRVVHSTECIHRSDVLKSGMLVLSSDRIFLHGGIHASPTA